MNTINLENIINQRKLSTHLILFLFSVVSLAISLLINPLGNHFEEVPGLLLLVFIQIEIFIFLGKIFFSGLKTAKNRKEMTIIVLSRFAVFMMVCFIIALIVFLGYLYLTGLKNGNTYSGIFSNFIKYELKGWSKSMIGGLSIGAVIFIFILWQDALKREQKLKEENLIFQNETLKNQVNPHFLFNSLNTVSSLIKSQPEKAEQFINDLSSVYRYILDNVRKEKVTLQEEIEFIKGYFDLHKVRDEGKMTLKIDDQDYNKYHILPVSLQILIENAIKHNTATRDHPLRILVYLEGQNVVVKNNLQKKATQMKNTAIGLINLSERITLSTGKTMIIEETNADFIVKVPLIL